MSSHKVISADNHVFEPPDLWTSRAEARFKERAPRVESLEAGDFWFCDGNRVLGVEGNAREAPRSADVRPGGYIPEEHIKDMDLDGCGRQPGLSDHRAISIQRPDSDLLTSNIRSYNDWVGEFCNAIRPASRA